MDSVILVRTSIYEGTEEGIDVLAQGMKSMGPVSGPRKEGHCVNTKPP